MVSEAGRAAAVRRRSTAHRIVELQRRIDRLRAGEAPTPTDVDRARASAEAQRIEFEIARHRLAETRAAAAHRRRHVALLSRSAAGTPEYQATPTDSDGYQRLRDAFVTLALRSVVDDDLAADQRRRSLASSVVDRATDSPFAGWSTALCVVGTRLPGVRGVAVTTYDRSGLAHPFTACNEWTRQVEEIQQLVGEGPGLTAHRTRRPVVVSRLSSQYGRWPGYVAAASDLDVEAVWALPIPLGGSSIGTLTFYRDAGRGATSWPDADTLAHLATSTMLVDLDEADHSAVDHADAYGVVDLAVGVLSVQLGVSVEQALARIRAHAFGSGGRMAEIARAILDHRLELS